ncbi:MAG: hypothetical protein AAGF85_10660 [Bacteroidota bacterium]
MKSVQHITIGILAFIILSCNKSAQEIPIADFELNQILIRPYDTLFITNTLVNEEGSIYKWSVNDLEFTNYENVLNPKIIISGWEQGDYEVSLEVISTSGESNIRSVMFTVGSYKIDGVSLTYIDRFSWDLDSTGINANPDIQFRWEIDGQAKYIGRIYWNIQANDLPLSIDIPNNIIHTDDIINALEFQFVDYDDFNKVEYLTGRGSLDRLSDSFDRELLTGEQEVFIGGWFFFKIEYSVIP